MYNHNKELHKRFEKAKSEKQQWQQNYDEVMRYIRPDRVKYATKYQNDAERIVDSIGEINAQTGVNNLMTTLTPPNKRWARLTVPETKKGEVSTIELEDATNILFSYINTSNLYAELSSSFLDLIAGMGALIIRDTGDKLEPVKYQSVPMSQVFIDDTGVFRELEVSGREVFSMFKGIELSSRTLQRIERDPSHKIKLIEMTVKAEITVTKDIQDDFGNIYSKTSQKVSGYKYIVMESDTKHIALEMEMETSPWVIFRWSVAPNEIYGRGMATQCIRDIKTLNELRNNLLVRSYLESNPTFFHDVAMQADMRQFQMKPGQIFNYRAPVGNDKLPVQALQLPPASIDTYQMMKDLIERVNETMFSRSVVKERPTYQTATEVSMDREEEFRRLGASLERVKYECLNNILDGTLSILIKQKIITTLTPLTKGDWSIKYESPYVGVQDQEDLISIRSFMATLGGIYGVEGASAMVKPQELVSHIAQLSRVSERFLLDEEGWARLMQGIQESSQETGLVNNGNQDAR